MAPASQVRLHLLALISTLIPSCAMAATVAPGTGPTSPNTQLAPFTAPVAPPATTWSNGLSTLLHFDAESVGIVGGSGRRRAISVGAFQAGLTLDTRRAGWWSGGQFDVMAMGLRNDGNLQATTGDAQLPSNLWAPNFLRIYQLSYRQTVGAGFVQGGIMDVNNSFDVTEVAGHLHNASFGIAPTLTGNADIATFPSPGLGLLGGLDLGDGLSAQAGVWQGDPPGLSGALRRGALLLGEIDKTWNRGRGNATTLKLGLWHQHQTDVPTAAGVYAIAEQSWRDAQHRRWSAFLQAGNAPEASSPVSAYLGAGVRARGLNAFRPADVLTVGLARARLRQLRAETVLEVVYSMKIAGHVYLQPDFQRIAHPGGGPGMQTVAGLRIHIER